jgi:aryl-alcohol dehydrogenase-like predicted oxidoreductase
MAIQWLLSQPAVTSLCPNIYDARQLEEFAAAPSTPAFTAEELIRVQDLYRNEFYLRAEPTPA